MEAGRVWGYELFSISAPLSPGFPSSTPPASIPEDLQWAYSTAQPALHVHWCKTTQGCFSITEVACVKRIVEALFPPSSTALGYYTSTEIKLCSIDPRLKGASGIDRQTPIIQLWGPQRTGSGVTADKC
ncbi:hypothetical protein Q8A73_005969 [Channa argus]|nr:hypothetical protein Q8A73_005969 [Channa argus]